MSEPTRLPLDAWLRAAYDDPAAGCPPPGAFLEAETAALSPEERRRLEEHADRCPACAAERDLARMYDAAPEIAGVRPEDVDHVMARLAAASPVAAAAAAGSTGTSAGSATAAAAVGAGPASSASAAPESGAQVIPFPGPSAAPAPRPAEPARPAVPRQAEPLRPAAPSAPPARTRARAARPWTRLAAAAMLALAAGLGYQLMRSEPPALPAPEAGEVRGATIEALAPLGELAEAPSELRWAPWNEASAYRVRIVEVDGTVLWEQRLAAAAATRPGAPAAALPLPDEVRSRLQPAVTYRWTVEALGTGGPDPARLALSEPAEFRVRP